MSDSIKKYEEDFREKDVSSPKKDTIEVGCPNSQDVLQNSTDRHEYGSTGKSECGNEHIRVSAGSEPISNENIYPVQIEQLDHGVIVTVGCKKFAFTTTDKALYYVKLYLDDTTETTRKFYDGSLFKL